MREKEYGWYLLGCDRLNHVPMSAEDFAVRWQEFEEHAEALKAAEKHRNIEELDSLVRVEMQKRMKDDPFVRAVLVGMAEETQDS